MPDDVVVLAGALPNLGGQRHNLRGAGRVPMPAAWQAGFDGFLPTLSITSAAATRQPLGGQQHDARQRGHADRAGPRLGQRRVGLAAQHNGGRFLHLASPVTVHEELSSINYAALH